MRARFARISSLLILTTAFAATAAPLHAHQNVESTTDLDLHAMCEQMARDCTDLNPQDYGMTPVTAAAVPPTDGTVLVDAQRNVQVRATLLDQRIHLHGALDMEVSAGYGGGSGGDPPTIPCGDDAGCPNLRVDARELFQTVVRDERTFSADHCAVQEGSTEAGNRSLLRFSFKSPNDGQGDLVVGDPDDNPSWFEWGQCHGHWHFREYADYRLWDLEGYAAWKTLRTAYPHLEPEAILDAFPELRDHFRAGHKQGFCVIDIVPPTVFFSAPPGSDVYGPAQYDSCAENQGITVGWSDRYHSFLDGQWVDVTGLDPGQYVLEAEVNPERFFAESSYVDNDSAVLVQL